MQTFSSPSEPSQQIDAGSVGTNDTASVNSRIEQKKPASRLLLAPFPSSASVRGPIANAALRRTFIAWLCIQIVSVLLIALSGKPYLEALGLGLMLPGGGFLLGSFWLHAVLVLVVFLILLPTVIIGNLFLTGLFYLGTAAWGSWMAYTGGQCSLYEFFGIYYGTQYWAPAKWLVPGLVVLGATAMAVVLQRREARIRKAHARLSARLCAEPSPITHIADDTPDPLTEVRELSLDELGHLRYVLNRALQPINQFDGFCRMDQVMSASLRYQLAAGQKSLALYRQSCAPAFSGYVDVAQRNLIEKMLDRRVWGYWSWENLLGNLRWNPDPVAHENVMFSGFLGTMAGSYMASTGDMRYFTKGALKFQWRAGTEYSYDFDSLNAVMQKQRMMHEDVSIPCEPGWNYTICNVYSLNSKLFCDKLISSTYGKQASTLFRPILEQEYISPDGKFLSARHRISGLALPAAATLAAGDGLVGYNLHPIYPDIAERSWELLRLNLFNWQDGMLRYNNKGTRIDLGDYSKSDAFGLVCTLLSAKEMGDQEAVEALQKAMVDLAPIVDGTGERAFQKASTLTNFLYAMALMVRRRGYYDLVHHGIPKAQRNGPCLQDAPYPEALVAKAVVDAGELQIVLYPGSGDRSVDLVFGNLEHNAVYLLESGGLHQCLTADASGTASASVTLRGRTTITVTKQTTTL